MHLIDAHICHSHPLFTLNHSLTQSPNHLCTYYEQLKAETKRHTDVFGGADSYDDRFDEYNNCEHTFLFIHSFFLSLIQDFKIISILLAVLWCGVV
jgi:hypothetical protein